MVSPSPKLASQLLNRERSSGSSGDAASSPAGAGWRTAVSLEAAEVPVDVVCVIPDHLCKGLHTFVNLSAYHSKMTPQILARRPLPCPLAGDALTNLLARC